MKVNIQIDIQIKEKKDTQKILKNLNNSYGTTNITSNYQNSNIFEYTPKVEYKETTHKIMKRYRDSHPSPYSYSNSEESKDETLNNYESNITNSNEYYSINTHKSGKKSSSKSSRKQKNSLQPRRSKISDEDKEDEPSRNLKNNNSLLSRFTNFFKSNK